MSFAPFFQEELVGFAHGAKFLFDPPLPLTRRFGSRQRRWLGWIERAVPLLFAGYFHGESQALDVLVIIVSPQRKVVFLAGIEDVVEHPAIRLFLEERGEVALTLNP